MSLGPFPIWGKKPSFHLLFAFLSTSLTCTPPLLYIVHRFPHMKANLGTITETIFNVNGRSSNGRIYGNNYLLVITQSGSPA